MMMIIFHFLSFRYLDDQQWYPYPGPQEMILFEPSPQAESFTQCTIDIWCNEGTFLLHGRKWVLFRFATSNLDDCYVCLYDPFATDLDWHFYDLHKSWTLMFASNQLSVSSHQESISKILLEFHPLISCSWTNTWNESGKNPLIGSSST